MAFYSKSVDDIGVEIDRPKLCTGSDTRYYHNSNAISDRPSNISRQASSLGGIYSRYINPAVCCAKIDTSMESLSDALPPIVPPLDLNSSGETMPSTDSAPCVSFTIQKTCEASRISQSNAFYNWLSGKKRLKSYEQTKQKQIEEERQQQLKERKELAEQKYKLWLVNKSQSKEKPPLQKELQEYEEVCQTHNDDSESNRKAWERKKMAEQRRKREQVLKIREQQRLEEEKRKQQANRAWQSWIAEAPLKPKPVPLNKGFLSLKGTISDIYINPNPWREPFEQVECE